MNPDNETLFKARFGVRADRYNMARAIEEARRQLEWLKVLPGEVKRSSGSCTGSLDVRISDLMPSGFVVHSASGH